MKPSRWLPAAGALVLLGLLGCKAGPPKRPLPGDRVTPEVYLPDPWQAGKPALFAVRLRVQPADGAASAYLRPDEVPEGVALRATVRFFRGEAPVHRLDDLPVTPPPC